MKLNKFIKLISKYIISEKVVLKDVVLTNITADSREALLGSVFFCIRGENADGHDFVDQAFKNGAFLAVGENSVDRENYIRVESALSVLKEVSAIFYDNPQNKLKMIGVTGTNGKTTITHMIESGLENRLKCGVIGTLGYKFSDKVLEARNTTPFIWKWYELLNKMVLDKFEVVVSEISSHGLEQERVAGTKFDVAVFTNLSRDHMDYHFDMESYYRAKKKLFEEHLKEEGVAVINVDDIYGERLYSELSDKANKVAVSLKKKGVDLYVDVKEQTLNGSVVIFKYKDKSLKKLIPMAGRFNVYNAACSIMACERFTGFELSVANICKKISVPGRMEEIKNESVYIDYAHTPDALENILSTIKEVAGSGRIIVVFGAGGNRDKGKRPEMGRVVCKYADIVFITDDNPRNEDPSAIVTDIKSGCSQHLCDIHVIHDRSEAIKKAIDLKRRDDVVIIAGKGAENYQITKHGKKFFSDKLEVEKYFER